MDFLKNKKRVNSNSKRIVIYSAGVIIIGLILFQLLKNFRSNLNILFIGIDGLDWGMVEPLAEQDLLPNFKRLINHGAFAKINTNENRGSSAVYWTTIATGQLSQKHGIEDFVIRDPLSGEMVPYTSNARKTKAFWNIFTERGISVGIIGWYLTWPVEKVKGLMVSSYYSLKSKASPTWKGTVYEGIDNMVYPLDLKNEINEFIQMGKNKYRQSIRQIIIHSTLKTQGRILTSVKWSIMADQIFAEIGINLYKKIKPRVFAVYFCGIDVIGHRFTSKDPEKQKRITEEFGDMHRNYYLHIDKLIGPFLNFADTKTIIIIASDHGLMGGDHTNNGVFIIFGPKIKKNIRLEKPINLTDICPTMLYLMGLPVAKDMDGRVFEDAISEEYLNAHKIKYINSYGKRKIVDASPKRSKFDAKIIERLKSLGYLN